ncbi:MAG TPA: lysophospholipid acyltransferase family protein [Ferruginibacter sp.]|nr:lysophospholipid acyltransferase family protein [Ferruginibacter sp.]
MKVIKKIIAILYTMYAFTVFVTIMFLILPFIIIASFFGKIKGGNFIYKLCKLWARLVLFMLGIFHKNIFEWPVDGSKHYVFVFNHISYLDIPVILRSVKKINFRVLGKAEMAKIPVFGFIYRSAAVLVERGDAEKRAKSVQQLKSVLNKGISVVIAPEGTFNMTHQPLKSFYDGAFKIAIETQTAIRPMLFLDTYNRLHYNSIFSLTPGRSRTIFLEEIPVEGLTMDDVELLKNKVFTIMETGLIRHKASWINSNKK